MKTDIKERLKQHADWLESCGEARTQAHVDPDVCKQAAKDIRQAITSIPDDTGQDCGYREMTPEELEMLKCPSCGATRPHTIHSDGTIQYEYRTYDGTTEVCASCDHHKPYPTR